MLSGLNLLASEEYQYNCLSIALPVASPSFVANSIYTENCATVPEDKYMQLQPGKPGRTRRASSAGSLLY